MAENADEGFKVTDRRRREEPEAREPSRGPAVPPSHGTGETAAPEIGPPDSERTLIGLFMMLASSAVVALGEVPDPVTGERHFDLAQAAEVIDLLVLLREKTEGHRSPDETQALQDLIYDLQVRYVSVTTRGAAPPGHPRS